MFLTQDNKLKTKLLLWATVVAAVFVIMGLLGLDKILYLLIDNPRCEMWRIGGGIWCSTAVIIGRVFSAKVLLLLTGVLLLLVFVRKTLDSGIKYKNANNNFSLVALGRDFMTKVRTNYAFLIFSSVLSAGIVAKILKVLIGRFRPVFFEGLGVTGFHPFSFDWAFNSMPSGHTAATFAGLIMAGMLAPKIKPVTWTLAIVVGVSRIYIGAHWPSDVILGAFIGMVAADLIKYWAFKRK